MAALMPMSPVQTAPFCASAAEHDDADRECRIQSLRGLGTMGAVAYTSGRFKGMDPCAVAALPICPPLKSGASSTLTFPVPTTTEEQLPAPAGEPNYLVWGGLLLLVLGGGGYAYYRAQKKAKKGGRR
jgi:hypothetical protein